MEFEWDDEKAAANLKKHGVAFEDAIAIFDDENAATSRAATVSEERRFRRTGVVADALLTVIYTWRVTADVEAVRVISARPASRKERRTYGDRTLRTEAPDPGTDRPA